MMRSSNPMQYYQDGGEVGMFEQQPGFNYGMVLPISRNLETGEKGFDPAAGVLGAVGRGIGTFEQYLSGAPVSDRELVEAGLDVIPTGAGVANIAAPAAAPGILGAFMVKHGSPRMIRGPLSKSAEPTMGTSVAGPGVYVGRETDDVLTYALREADRAPVTESDMSFSVGRNAQDNKELMSNLKESARNEVMDLANSKRYYFMDDGSLVVNDLSTGAVERRGKGSGYVYNALVDANEEQFLDFSLRYEDQPDTVRRALDDVRMNLNVGRGDTGKTIYTRLSNMLGGQDAANEYLETKGLAGNKFLQQGKEMMVIYNPDMLDVKVVQPVSQVPEGKKFANGGGVGTLAPTAKGMFDQRSGIASMSETARNMFRR